MKNSFSKTEMVLALLAILLSIACANYALVCGEKEPTWVIFLVALPLVIVSLWRSVLASGLWPYLIGANLVLSTFAIFVYVTIVNAAPASDWLAASNLAERLAGTLVGLSLVTIPACIYSGGIDFRATDDELGEQWSLPGHLLPALGLSVVMLLLVANSLALALALRDQVGRLKGKGPTLSFSSVRMTKGPLVGASNSANACGSANQYLERTLIFKDNSLGFPEANVAGIKEYEVLCQAANQGLRPANDCAIFEIVQAIRCAPAGTTAWVTLIGESSWALGKSKARPSTQQMLASILSNQAASALAERLEHRKMRVREEILNRFLASFPETDFADQRPTIEWRDSFVDTSQSESSDQGRPDILRVQVRVAEVAPGPVWVETLAIRPELLDYFYFMIYSITTTGYGDIKPATPFAKAVASLANLYEVFFLIILTNLVVARSFAKNAEDAKHPCRYLHEKADQSSANQASEVPTLPAPTSNNGEPGTSRASL